MCTTIRGLIELAAYVFRNSQSLLDRKDTSKNVKDVVMVRFPIRSVFTHVRHAHRLFITSTGLDDDLFGPALVPCFYSSWQCCVTHSAVLLRAFAVRRERSCAPAP